MIVRLLLGHTRTRPTGFAVLNSVSMMARWVAVFVLFHFVGADEGAAVGVKAGMFVAELGVAQKRPSLGEPFMLNA